jgi:hypothetical protein
VSDDPKAADPPPSDRRSFLKRLTGEAVQAAGTLAGTGAVVMRSATAAGEAAAAGLGLNVRPDVEQAPETTPASVPSSPAPPLRPLTPRESELLSSTTAVIAVNTPEGTPQLTRAPFHWDGDVARMLGHLFGARIANVQRDGRISVLVEDERGWLTLIGEATVVTGPSAQIEAAPLLARDHPDRPPEAAWIELNTTTDLAVIVLRPTRIVSQAG